MPAGFSLLGELEEDDDEEDEKLTPVRPGGLVAVFCPVRLFRHTGQLSCFVRTEGGGSEAERGVGAQRPRPRGSPAAARARCSRHGRGGCRAAAVHAPPARSRPCTRGTPARSLRGGEPVTARDPRGSPGARRVDSRALCPGEGTVSGQGLRPRGREPHTYVFLGDGDGGEGLDFLFVCRRGACVFKLIEELKDKRPECRELGRQVRPLAPQGSEIKAGLPAKAPRLVLRPPRPSPALLPALLLVPSGPPRTQGAAALGTARALPAPRASRPPLPGTAQDVEVHGHPRAAGAGHPPWGPSSPGAWPVPHLVLSRGRWRLPGAHHGAATLYLCDDGIQAVGPPGIVHRV